MDEAKTMLAESGVKITSEGKKYLGYTLRTTEFNKSFCEDLASKFTKMAETLCEIAKAYPQEAYAGYIFGLSNKWTYFCRSVSEMRVAIIPLDEVVKNRLLPTVIGTPISSELRNIVALSTRLGRLGIPLHAESRAEDLRVSQKVTEYLVHLIKCQSCLTHGDLKQSQGDTCRKIQTEKDKNNHQKFTALSENASQAVKRCLTTATERGIPVG